MVLIKRNVIVHVVVIIFLCIFTISAFGRMKPYTKKPGFNNYRLSKTAAEFPPDIMLSWIGAGYLTKYTISNTGQSGVFEPPPGWRGYNGMWPTGFGMYNGRTGEFPRGTNQYYVWGAGLWIGGKSPNFNTADDKTIKPKGTDYTFSNVRVAATAYYSDCGAVSRLWQSNQTINGQIDGKDPKQEGNYLFGQKNKNIEDYQDIWACFTPRQGDYYGMTEEDTIYRLDYEEINKKRQKVLEENSSLDPDLILLDSFRKDQKGNIVGDIISDEDTYTVFGDFIKERYASFLWTAGYDLRPLGVRVVQRTYSWNIDDYIYINYKIKNMNDFPIDSVFIGYFMDNDIGYADDDLIGFDKKLNLGYSYDYDLMETGWQTSAGYIGSIFVETPEDTIEGELKQIGLTGFQTWIRSDLGDSEGFYGGDVDDDGMDHLKYAEMAFVDSFEVFEEPQDVRQLTCSGPVKRLNPGDEISVTIAIVAGASLAELKANTQAAIDKYNSGFIGPEPPSSPSLTVIPGHGKAYLSWSNDPLDDIDPYTGEQDFEGFRVYRSSTGLQDDWKLLAECDVAGDSTKNTATAEYTKGSSNTTAVFAGVMGVGDLNGLPDKPKNDEERQELFYERFKESEYTVEFAKVSYTPDYVHYYDTTKFVIYDVTQRQLVPLNIAAQSDGFGFCVFQNFDGNKASSKVSDSDYGDMYRSGYYIYFNGMYIQIKNGYYVDTDQDGQGNGIWDSGEAFGDLNGNGIYDESEPFIDVEEEEKTLQTLKPVAGDIFTIKSYLAKDIGDQTDLTFTYIDEGLTNGMIYYYAVTSYDRGYPDLNIPPLESSYYQNIQSVIPQHQPLEIVGEPGLTDVEHIGESTGRILRGILDHRDLQGHEYEVKFFKNDPNNPEYDAPVYGIMFDNSLTPIEVSNEITGAGNDSTVFNGRLSEMDIFPGTVKIKIDDESGIVTDDSLGRLSGVINQDTISGVIHYGKGKFSLTRDQNLFTSSTNIIAEYKYSTLRLMHWGPDTLTGTAVKNKIYSVKELHSDSTTTEHGFLFKIDSPKLEIDSVAWGIGTEVADIYRAEIRSVSKIEPYDYVITFPGTMSDLPDSLKGSISAAAEMPNSPVPYQRMPWKVWNISLDLQTRTFNTYVFLKDEYVDWIVDVEAPYDSLNKNTATILSEDTRENNALTPYCFTLEFVPIDTNLATADYLDPPTEDDTLFIFTSRPITPLDVFTFKTINMNTPVEKIDMDKIKVVPNPYYVKAAWDKNRYTQHIDFRHLPSGTIANPVHIRIFNVAGYLIAHLKKNGIVGKNEVLDEYGTLSWDLRNYEGLKVASGLYIYQIEAKINGKTKTHTGKIAIVLGP